MTIASERTYGEPRVVAPRGRRDGSIDAVRATLLLTVVALHATMVGVSMGAAGPVLENALENQGWFAPASWIVQVMPLFFIVGGFSSISQWRGMRARGASPSSYVRGRIDRLVRPAIALTVIVGAALVAMTMAGVPADVVATAGYRIGQPLWFLAVYILCSALVPLMVRAHERLPVAAPLLLLSAVVAVDVARMASGVEAVGFLNLVFVWLLVQQLGFALADGVVERLATATRGAVLGASLGVLVALTSGVYPADMFTNLNPPTVCLVILGVAQVMVFSLLRHRFAALAAWRPAARIIATLGQRGMTVYLWHMPVLIAMAAVLLVLGSTTGLPLPTPLTAEWWLSRPLWLAVAGLVVAPVAAVLWRFERGARAAVGDPAGPRSAALDTVLGAGGVAIVLVAGFGPVPASVALLLLTAALLGTSRIVSSTRRASVALRRRGASLSRMMHAAPAVDAALRTVS